MSPNKQSRKQRTRAKNTTIHTRERTVLTLAEDSASEPPYLLPNQPAFPPALGNMFSQFQPHGQSQPGVSIPDRNSFQYQQQPSAAHPFNQLQTPAFFNHMQPFPQGQTQDTGSGDSLSDLEKLRQLKSTILAGQHPYFQPIPNPDALASVYLGPHPASQVNQRQQHQQQQQQQSTQPGHGPASLSQSQSESANAIQKPEPPAQGSSKPPQTPNLAAGPGPSRASGSFTTPQSMTTSASVTSGMNHEASLNGASDGNNGRLHPKVTISPKSVDYSSTSPAAQPPNTPKSSPMHPPQHHQRGPPSGTSGTNNEQDRMPPPVSVLTSQKPLNDVVGFNRTNEDKESAAAYREAHPDAPPGTYERERDRDRERSGYHPYDPSRYSQASDRRDTGRFPPRYPDSRYDRDWDRDRERDHEREREREREKDRDRRRVDDKPLDDRRFEYERSSRFSVGRPPQPGGDVEQKQFAVHEQRITPGQVPEQRRPDVSVDPERRPAVPHPEQSPHSDPAVSRSVPPPLSSSTDQRRPDAPGSSFSFPSQPPHERERSRFGPPTTARIPPPQGNSNVQSQFQPLPPQSLRQEQSPASGSASVNDRPGLHSGPPTQRAPPVNTSTRTGPPSPETNRHPESMNPAGRPPAAGTKPPSADNSVSRVVPDQRLMHPGDPPPPPRVPAEPESRAGHEDRDTSHPFPPHPSALPAPSATSHPSSPVLRQPSNVPYSDRDRAAPNYREPPPSVTAARGFAEDLRRQSLETSALRRTSDYYPPTPPAPAPPVVDRQNEVRQWRERESYPPGSYPGSDAERERARRYSESREWHGSDPYARERAGDIDMHPRGRPHPPASWDRERPVDKDKDRERYEGWNAAERKYATHDPSAPPPSRWEDPVPPPPPPPPPPLAHRPPLHARLTDTYDERFIPAERARYPPPPPTPSEDMAMRDGFRENPRVRPRSPSPIGRPFDDAHRAKRPREEYEPLARPPYYEDARRPPGPPPPAEYGARVPPSPPPYYDPRAPGMVNPRDPSPYSRERAPDPYARREIPPPRSPPFYARGRYPTR